MDEIKENEYPSIFWKKFFDQFPEIEIKPIEQWKSQHLLAYFCKLYKKQYGLKYTFKFDGTPSKCYETFQLKKVASMLSSDPKILKDYIDWVFKEKVIQRKKRITVIGFLSSVDMICEYKFKFLVDVKHQVIERTASLEEKYIDVLKAEGMSATTYGDLVFINDLLNSDCDSEYRIKYDNIFNKLESIGFDKSSLLRIK